MFIQHERHQNGEGENFQFKMHGFFSFLIIQLCDLEHLYGNPKWLLDHTDGHHHDDDVS